MRRSVGAWMIGIAAAIALGACGTISDGGAGGPDGGGDATQDQSSQPDAGMDAANDSAETGGGGDASDAPIDAVAGDAAIETGAGDASRDVPAGDVASGDGASPDVASGGDAPPAPCNLQAPFGMPAAVAGLPSQIEVQVSATLSPDELTAYYSRTMGAVGGWDIYVAKRAHRTDPFDDGAVLTALSTTSNDIASSVSRDGLSLYFYTDKGRAAGAWQIYVATRADQNAGFSSFAPVTALNGTTTTSQDEEAFVSASGSELYFASLRSANGDIYVSSIASGGVVGMPAKAPAINSANSDFSPVLSADGLTIFWASDRPDGNAKGDFDIWTASRASTDANFASPKNVAELNTDGHEEPAFLSPDGCRLYFGRSPARIDIRTVMMAERPQ